MAGRAKGKNSGQASELKCNGSEASIVQNKTNARDDLDVYLIKGWPGKKEAADFGAKWCDSIAEQTSCKYLELPSVEIVLRRTPGLGM